MAISTNTVSTSKGPDPKSLIQVERERSLVDTTKMNYFLEGSKEKSELVQDIIQQFERDPILSTSPDYYEQDKAKQREATARKIDRLSRYLETDTPEVFHSRLSLIGLIDPQVSTRVGINLGLFLSCIRGNGTLEQIDYWTNKKGTVKLRNIYGCFGMTEMGHGSNVPGLETTATFDKKTDEFVINTPHIGATKWWIGGAAHSATHCSVYARLIVDGKDYGVKTFVVPLRDTNFDMYPGVTVGDIGAKMGRDGIDNGWIQFSNVRIPRFFMLQKFCKVTREGEVTLPPLEQLAYSALLGGRVNMVVDSFRVISRMTTIALRYAVGRRQFKEKGAELETQIIDYPLHQRRLLPYLALGYVISASSWKLEKTIENTLNTLDNAAKSNDMGKIMASIEEMKSLFVDSGSLKSTCTWLAADVIDECRQACGGHGYSAYSGFGKAYNDWVVQCTWEGDNNILATSIGKPLINHLASVLDKGKKVKGSLSFLNDAKQYLNDKPVLESLDDLKDTRKVLRAVEVAIIRLGNQATINLKENNGKFDSIGPDMVIISKLKAHHYLLTAFLDKIDETEDKEIVPYLQSLGRLYSASIVLQKFSGDFLAYSVIPTKLISVLTSTFIPQLCKEIRPHVIPLTDSFKLTDMVINSSIGNYDGNFYENYFTKVKTNNPPSNTKAPYTEVLTSMLNRGDLDDRNRFEKTGEAAKILSK